MRGLGLGVGLSAAKAASGGSAPVIPGSSATTLAIAPTYHLHVNTAAVTVLGGTSTINFNISVGSSNITVTSVTGSPIAVGMELIFTSTPTYFSEERMRVLAFVSGTLGGPGVYTVTGSGISTQTGLSATLDGSRAVVSITDTNGLTAVPVATGLGPLLMTDARGIKFLRFTLQTTSQGPGFPMKVAGLSNLDNHQMSWFSAMRATASKGGCLISLGIKGAGGLTVMQMGWGNASVVNRAPGINTLRGYLFESGWIYVGATPSKMLVHTGLQVIGVSMSSTSALNVTGGSATYARLYHNENCLHIDNTNVSRNISVSGFSIGHIAGNSGGTEGSMCGDVYEIVGYTADELAPSHTGATRPTETATNADAVQAAMVSNYAITPITKSVLVTGDSRVQNNETIGNTIASIMTDPGAAYAVPANYRVFYSGHAGEGTQEIYATILNPLGPFDTNWMLGGGNDHCIAFWGANDLGTATDGTWPTNNTPGDTTDRADEVFNMKGGVYSLDSTFTASISGSSMPVTAVGSGKVQPDQMLAYSGSAPGVQIVGPGYDQGGTNGGLPGTYTIDYQSAGASAPSVGAGTAMTGTWGTRIKVWQAIFDRGWNGTHFIEPAYANSASVPTQDRLRSHDINDLAGAVTPQSGRSLTIVDPRQIQIGGSFPFGVNYASFSTYYKDGIHQTTTGMIGLVSGFDTPAYGIKAAALAH